MSRPAVTVVVPVWNGRELLLTLLETLRAQTYPIAEVIAVDNGSVDGAAEGAEQQGARVLRLGSNQGFSRAVNCGVEACQTELIAIVNSDVELEPYWLERLVQALDPVDVWFATGKILNASRRDRIDGTYDLLSRAACAWRVGNGRPDGPYYSCSRPIAMAPATAALFRTELFRRVGPLDPDFESYLEDVDFGLRCALEGLSGAYVPGAVAYHWGSASLGKWSPETVWRIARNQVYIAYKYYPFGRYWWPILVGQFLWGLLALRHGTGSAYLRGKVSALRRLCTEPRLVAPLSGSGQGARLAQILQSAEREIRDAQRRTGFDWFWRVYFLLTSSGAD